MLTVLFGLIGLSIVVIIHEFGHFVAARAMGVDVETFSIGWGPRLFGFKKRGTEWRISAFPIGGFCRMKGEEDFKAALEKKLPYIPTEKGSFYGASPWRRILILVSGPLFNIIFAALLFSVVSLVGITIQTAPNRIVLASESSILSGVAEKNPADQAGLLSGDVIASIDGTAVRDYSDLQEIIGLNPGKRLNLVVERNGAEIDTTVTPRLEKNSGQGLIGIYAWIDPRIKAVDPQGSAAIAGLQKGDIVSAIEGKPIRNTVDIMTFLAAKPEKIVMTVLRNGTPVQARLVLSYTDKEQSNLGLSFESRSRTDRASSFLDAAAKGGAETYKTFAMTVKGIGMLFSGVNVLKAVSGPARITYLVGSTATESIKASGFSGIPTILSFLAFLSVSLFIMNLLPIPALDGGQIVLSVTEILRRKPLLTKTIYRFQFVGAAMIMVLFFLATFSDVLFFAGK
jgi:regulator of sigma E protease